MADCPFTPFWRSIWPAVIVATIVLVGRGAMIAANQSERYDDEYHLNRGLAFLRGDVGGRKLNDPPLGEALGALPLLVTGSYNADPAIDMGIFGHRRSPETLLLLVGVWKSLLLVPMVAVAFLWTRELYGLASAWFAVALLLIEPTIAAHAPLPSVDVIGVEGIVIACYAVWQYVRRPTMPRLLLAAAAVALGMMLKNTALILPGVALLFAALCWIARRNATSTHDGARRSWRRRVAHVAIGAVALPLCLWAMSGFDVSVPMRKQDVSPEMNRSVARLMRKPWPAGVYVRSVVTGIDHMRRGHASFLNGEKLWGGRPQYFPIVATYKLPVGLGAALALGVASLAWRRPRFEELSLALPLAVYLATLLNTQINIGFRHFLPVVAFALLLATRAIADAPASRFARWRAIVAIACCGIAFVETARVHPNYLSFTNALRGPPWLKISDSNLDWGQSLPALRRWADARTDDRPIRFAYFGWELPDALRHHLGGSRVEVVMRPRFNEAQPAALPTRGIFVVSPVALAGVYDRSDRLRPLRGVKPVEVIDGCLLVYDLDRMKKRIQWPKIQPPKKTPLIRSTKPPVKKKRPSTAPAKQG